MNINFEAGANKDPRNEAIQFVLHVMDIVAKMGANDTEMSTLTNLLERIRSGEIDSRKGKEIAQKILDSKNAYH